MTGWTKGWWVLVVAFEVVILASIAGASVTNAVGFLLWAAVVYAIIHLGTWLGGDPV